MNQQRFPEEFKAEAAKQAIEHGHSVADVSRRLGVSTHNLYKWIKQQQMPLAQRTQQANQSNELRRLKVVLKRVTEEHDILKKAATDFTHPPTENTKKT
jgi:transposase